MAEARRLLIPWRCRRLRPLLVDCAEGALDDGEARRVRAHAAECDECGTALAALEDMRKLLPQEVVPERDEEFWRRQRQSILRRVRPLEPGTARPPLVRRFAWAAGLAAAAVMALIVARQRSAELGAPMETVAVDGLAAGDVIELAELSAAWDGDTEALAQSGIEDDFLATAEISWAEPGTAGEGPAVADLDEDELEHLEELIG